MKSANGCFLSAQPIYPKIAFIAVSYTHLQVRTIALSKEVNLRYFDNGDVGMSIDETTDVSAANAFTISSSATSTIESPRDIRNFLNSYPSPVHHLADMPVIRFGFFHYLLSVHSGGCLLYTSEGHVVVDERVSYGPARVTPFGQISRGIQSDGDCERH